MLETSPRKNAAKPKEYSCTKPLKIFIADHIDTFYELLSLIDAISLSQFTGQNFN
jgi:hypothetical protein